MAVTLRMSRKGTTHRPFYHIVATDSRNKLSGSFIEQVGIYDPLGDTELKIDAEKARKWLAVGATQSATVKKLLKRAGITGATAATA